jgi:hypothetical protein
MDQLMDKRDQLQDSGTMVVFVDLMGYISLLKPWIIAVFCGAMISQNFLLRHTIL